MSKRVVILDTSVVCCLLKVPGKETAGSGEEQWDFDRISALVEEEIGAGSVLVLPVATLIETGNHIAQAPGDRHATSTALCTMISAAAEARTPWAAFTDQADLWGTRKLQELAISWPKLAVGGLTIGDATIKDVAEYYAQAGFQVEIVTGDAGLKAYQPSKPIATPRRRR